MARHVAAAEMSDRSPSDALPDAEAGRDKAEPRRLVIAAVVIVSMALAGLGGWFAVQDWKTNQQQVDAQGFVATGRQAAVNLTTIDFTRADADVARILDSATGPFLDDFQKRAKPFIEVVKQVKSKSNGTVTDAGIEYRQGNDAQVLVGVRVNTSTDGAPALDIRQWRMRIDVKKVGGDFKIANVQFVQ